MTLIEALRLAVQHYQAGRLTESEQVCRAILAAVPDQAETHQLLGLAALGRGRTAEAAIRITTALALKPELADGYSNLGVLRQNQGRLNEGVALQSWAIRLNPGMGDAYLNRGSVRQALADREGAVADYQEAIRLRRDNPQAFNNMGAVWREMGRGRLSIESHRRAIALSPGMVEAYRDLGHIMREAGLQGPARDAYGRALLLDPSRTEALSYHVFAKQVMCDWAGYDELVRRIGAIIDKDEGLVLPLATLAMDTTAEQQLRSAQRFYRTAVCAAPADGAVRPPPAADGRLRVAYFSADFHEHATAYLAAELFELHDRDRFSVTAYSYGNDDGSPMRQRLVRAFDRFHDIRGVGLEDIARMTARDGIDILIELKGYTRQSRLELLSRRLAPVQVAYLGYPGTIGCPLMDYVIGDRWVTPLDQQPFYTERLVAMPDSYQINDRCRPIAETGPDRAACGLPADAFVFCAFNTTYKITPAVFAIWMRLLAGVPNSLLWLFEANGEAVGNLRREAGRHGIAADRLVFAPKRPLPEHLARYRLADLCLDTFPYTGHTTTSDALWAGLPVVTALGGTFASRVASSLLDAAGVPELIAPSLAAYEELALSLARDPIRLAGLRHRLIDTRMTVPLFDSRRFTRHLERAFTIMWDHHRAGRPPQGFAVPALPPGTPD